MERDSAPVYGDSAPVLRLVPKEAAKYDRVSLAHRLATFSETIINHNPDLPAGIVIVGGIVAVRIAGLI